MSKEAELREAYNEQMFERRANGLGTVSFEEWKYHQEHMRRVLQQLDAERQAKDVQHG